MKAILYFLMVPGICMLYFNSCKKLIEVDAPQNQLTTGKVFTDTTSAKSALLNIYALCTTNLDPNYNTYMSLYSDELNYNSSSVEAAEFEQGQVAATNSADLNIWNDYYLVIYSCNDLITQLTKDHQLPAALVRQYTGEAKFLRAYAYFFLINLYGPVPLTTTTAVTLNASLARTDTAAIYRQVLADLSDAQSSLTTAYSGSGRVRVNQLAAVALRARVSLYRQDWAGAIAASGTVINSGLYSLQVPDGVFQANNEESILQFWNQYGYVGLATQYIPDPNSRPVYPLSKSLLAAFETGDRRKSSWTRFQVSGEDTLYYPYKYHNTAPNSSAPEYVVALRLGEQYLIRAEAEARSGQLAEARADLNKIRDRAGLSPTVAADQATLLTAIAHERQIELYSEWAHRFLDLKRTGRADALLAPVKPGWKRGVSILLPIPQNEIIYDHNLTQNAGY